ncbi:MAG: DUF3108 domain-containing protein [Micropepsaceae bacterium]
MRGARTALALAALTGAASAETLTLDYQMRVMGFTVAYARVDAAIEDTRYTIRVTGENTGLADLFGSLTLDATASGAFPGRIIVPTYFETRNLYDGAPRQTRVVWTGADANPEIITPSLEVEDRTPIPDEAREDALDPISALLAFAYGEPSRWRCLGDVKVYDGRRSYTLTLDEGIVERVRIGSYELTALKCRIVYLRTGGKAPGGWLSSSDDRDEAEIWFWIDGEGRALPVLLEGDAPIGSAVAELQALPGYPND